MIAAALLRAADRLIERLVNHLLATDPGLARLQNAARVALACLLTGTLCIAVALHAHQPLTIAAPGVLFAMIAPLFVRDVRRSAWFASLLCLYVSACVAFAASACLSRFPLAGDAGFLVVMFGAMLVHACGPRALGGGMLAVVMFYLGLYLHPSMAEAIAALTISIAAPLVIAIVGRVLLPARPERTLRLAVHTVSLRAARVLAGTARDSHNALPDSAARAANLSALNEAALALEDQLARPDLVNADAMRGTLVEVEIAAGRHSIGAASTDDTAHALRHAIAQLQSLAQRTGRALDANLPPSKARASFADWRSRFTWLPATRTTTAAAFAMLLGHSLSPERWFWAVITTFVVFLGTRSRADTIYRGAQRLAGTLAGALATPLLIVALHHQPWLMVAAMIACVFGWAYYILASYAPGVFFITLLVGLVYNDLGFAMRPLLELRFEEVLIGCGVSFAVALLLMPLATTRHAEKRLAAMLDAMREVVRIAALQTTTAANSETSNAMRALDRSWHELRVALRPLQTQPMFLYNPGIERVTAALLYCLHCARVLSRAMPSGIADSAGERQLAESIVARLDALSTRYSGLARTSPGESDMHPAMNAHTPQANHALAQLDDAISLLAQRLGAPGNKVLPHFHWAPSRAASLR